MADEQDEVTKRVVYENVSRSTTKNNIPVIVFVLLVTAVIAWWVLTRFT
jgi:hypothetical protein